MNDRITEQQTHWDKMAGKYEKFYSLDSDCAKQKIERKATHLISAFWSKDIFVLEVGCGTGIFTKELATTEANIAAIDLSLEMINMANENCQRHNVGFYICDAHKLRYPDKTFDAIVGAYVLHYFDVDEALKGFYRVLKDDCSIAFVEPNKLNPVLFALTHIGFIKKIFKRSKYANSYSKWELKKILERNEFRSVRIYSGEFVCNRKLNRWLESLPIIREFGGTLFIKASKRG